MPADSAADRKTLEDTEQEDGDQGHAEHEGDSADKSDMQAAIRRAVEQETGGLKRKNSELIDTNKQLKAQVEKFTAALGDHDPDQVKEMLDRLAKDEEARLAAEGKTDELIKRRTERIESKHKAEIEKLTKQQQEVAQERDALQAKVEDLIVGGQARDHFVKAGGLEAATEDAEYRARKLFRLENDTPVARDAEGNLIQGRDGPLTMEEYMSDELRQKAPHLFRQATGSGARGNDSGGSSGGEPNPWKPDSLNLTRQAQLLREDPERAARLKRAAGHPV